MDADAEDQVVIRRSPILLWLGIEGELVQHILGALELATNPASSPLDPEHVVEVKEDERDAARRCRDHLDDSVGEMVAVRFEHGVVDRQVVQRPIGEEHRRHHEAHEHRKDVGCRREAHRQRHRQEPETAKEERREADLVLPYPHIIIALIQVLCPDLDVVAEDDGRQQNRGQDLLEPQIFDGGLLRSELLDVLVDRRPTIIEATTGIGDRPLAAIGSIHRENRCFPHIGHDGIGRQKRSQQMAGIVPLLDALSELELAVVIQRHSSPSLSGWEVVVDADVHSQLVFLQKRLELGGVGEVWECLTPCISVDGPDLVLTDWGEVADCGESLFELISSNKKARSTPPILTILTNTRSRSSAACQCIEGRPQ